MRKFLIAAVFVLALASPIAAQKLEPDQPDHTMDALLAARAKLIQRYAGKLAKGVAVCGEEDLLTGSDHSYLTVYAYRASVKEFLTDFVGFATQTSGNLGVDGIPVIVELVGPPAIETRPDPRLKTARNF